MIDIDLGFIGTVSDNELRRLLKKENNKELEERSKAYKAEKERREETIHEKAIQKSQVQKGSGTRS